MPTDSEYVERSINFALASFRVSKEEIEESLLGWLVSQAKSPGFDHAEFNKVFSNKILEARRKKYKETGAVEGAYSIHVEFSDQRPDLLVLSINEDGFSMGGLVTRIEGDALVIEEA